MSTFAQTSDNDLAIVEGQLSLVSTAGEEAALELRNKFLFVQGEYFLDTRQGVPYLAYVFVKNPNLLLIRSLFRHVIMSCDKISAVLDLTTDFDATKRVLTFSFRAQAIDGSIVTGGSSQPFIVEP